MSHATIPTVCCVAAIILLALCAALLSADAIRALRGLDRDDATARQRYWRAQYGQEPPALP